MIDVTRPVPKFVYREMTQFSDLRHEAGTPLYPAHNTMLNYLTSYAERFDLPSRIRLCTRVTRLAQHSGNGWTLSSVSHDGTEIAETYPYVVVASRRFNQPKFPDVPGLSAFSGPCGVVPTFQYKNPEFYRDRRVLMPDAQ